MTPDPANPHILVVSGSIPERKPQLTVYRVPDAADWARTLFIEALERTHVSVGAPALRSNDQSRLPAEKTVPTMPKLAALRSPPLQALGSMILRTSYNT